MGNEVRKTMNLKNRTSCLFKIVLFIIFSIFVAEIIVLPKIEHSSMVYAEIDLKSGVYARRIVNI